MLVGRRIFIQGMAFVASAPAFAAKVLCAPRQVHAFDDKAAANRIVFKIESWDLEGAAETSRAMSGTVDTASVGEDNVWIGVNRAWRANWR